ncbi:MAG: lipoprotein signal peptidase [Bacteroidales bacterium]|jgi:signal peptidase II|nr:lipoprotein signal peptidase [Bacteroidales bacterium]MDD4770323.1 lipoprotein signal peptidase [Bacteroidales bacterium]HKL92091.1 lipoprotein signal peptidase [Bacteroidales bacterium]
MSVRNRAWLSVCLIAFVLIVDQWSKVWIKLNMELYDHIRITDWFYIYFTENNGMAFGIEFFDKFFLTLFRILAVGAMSWYLHRLIKNPQLRTGYMISMALIIAGAFGNIIDSVFYGVLFDHSMGQLAEFLPITGGYGSLFHGKVVDLLYFPLIDTVLPEWIPWMGGEHFVFFRPVFNVADTAISTGIILLMLFYRHDLSDLNELRLFKKKEKTA